MAHFISLRWRNDAGEEIRSRVVLHAFMPALGCAAKYWCGKKKRRYVVTEGEPSRDARSTRTLSALVTDHGQRLKVRNNLLKLRIDPGSLGTGKVITAEMISPSPFQEGGEGLGW